MAETLERWAAVLGIGWRGLRFLFRLAAILALIIIFVGLFTAYPVELWLRGAAMVVLAIVVTLWAMRQTAISVLRSTKKCLRCTGVMELYSIACSDCDWEMTIADYERPVGRRTTKPRVEEDVHDSPSRQ